MDNYTESERKRHQLITEIQGFQKSGLSIRKIAKITGKQRQTIKKYLDGDPDVLCRSKKRSQLELCTDEIIKGIKAGLTSSAIGKQIQKKGYKCTLSNIRQFITTIAEQHELEISKYKSKIHPNESGKDKKTPVDYVTRKGIFNHLWMNIRLTPAHREFIWNTNKSLFELEYCIRDFREIFEKKSMPRLYLFIDRYKNSSIKEIASFALGLEKDLAAVENAVASPLSNGFVEGTNSKVKTIKKAMYGRCSKLLLSAKLMYRENTKH